MSFTVSPGEFGAIPRSLREVFTVEARERLSSELIEAARADGRVSAAALVGSAAAGAEDRWSDVDLALCVQVEGDRERVIAQWTARMYERYGALHHLDVAAGGGLYRAFLLPSTLQVDLSFWPGRRFAPTAPSFRLLFGEASEARPGAEPAADALIGEAWLYALHAHRCIARGRPWQAEHMISAVRDRVLALACVRHGLPARYGRGFDDVPAAVIGGLTDALVRSLEPTELKRALAAAVASLSAEIDHADPDLARRVAAPLRELGAL